MASTNKGELSGSLDRLSLFDSESVDSTESASDDSSIYLLDSSSGQNTVELPPANERSGELIAVKDDGQNASTNAIVIEAAVGDTIEGTSSITLDNDAEAALLGSVGDQWVVVGRFGGTGSSGGSLLGI